MTRETLGDILTEALERRERVEHITEANIEAYIDTFGLIHLLVMLENICSEKAEHIRTNWQDSRLANNWGKRATAIYNAANRIQELEGKVS